ncbi:hypothetical protein GCM10018773_15920 [Streptomyces candidus]|nr:hypothetical protein GCM10018773_15920 [Streptomyces candidus]
MKQYEGRVAVTSGVARTMTSHFTPFVLMQWEEYGFCGPGGAADFVAADGLPLNTHGGHLVEAYLYGMNGIAEAVRQVRGASVNQVPGVGRMLVTAGTGVPTSGLILGADRCPYGVSRGLRDRMAVSSPYVPNQTLCVRTTMVARAGAGVRGCVHRDARRARTAPRRSVGGQCAGGNRGGG